jgi:hypothetical protein
MTSDQRGPYAWGDTRATMASTKGSQGVIRSESPKTGPSSDRRLQFAFVKLESLVTVNQPRYGEYVPGSCTHRPSSHERQKRPKDGYPLFCYHFLQTIKSNTSRSGDKSEGPYHGGTADWD